jgi:hypothetical protein
MSNPYKDYKDNLRSNLPVGMTYDSDKARFVVNSKTFANPWVALWYLRYIQNFGYIVDPTFKTSSGSVSVPAISSASTFIRTVKASGAANLPTFISAGSSDPITNSDGEVNLAAALASGVAERILTSGGATTFAGFTVSGIAERSIISAGTPNLPSFSTSGTSAVTGDDTTAPTASSLVFGAQDANGDVAATLTDLSENGTLGIVWTSTDQSAATNAQIKTAAEGGAALTNQLSISTQAVTTGGGPYTISDGLPSSQDATLYWQAVIWDASDNISAVFSGSQAIDTTAPTVSTRSPADNATDVAVDASLVMTFSEGMARQGTVVLKNVGGATIETFDLSTDGTWSTVSETDDRVTLVPASDFTGGATLAVQWSGLEDSKGNALADNATDTTWNFSVVAVASGLTPEQDVAGGADSDNGVFQRETNSITIGSNANRVLVCMVCATHSAGEDLSATTMTFGTAARSYGTGTSMTVLDAYNVDDGSERQSVLIGILVNPSAGAGTVQIDTTATTFDISAISSRLYEYSGAKQTIGNYLVLHSGGETTTLSTSGSVSAGALVSALTILSGDFSTEISEDTTATVDATGSTGTTGFSDLTFAFASEDVSAGTDGHTFSWTTSAKSHLATLNIPEA